MKLNLNSFIAIAFLLFEIAFTPTNSTLAAINESRLTNTARQAAQEVVKDTGVKEQFGQSENGERLIDNARAKAKGKLNNLAEKADGKTALPDSKKLFLDNLSDRS